jgi:hypothetical protein
MIDLKISYALYVDDKGQSCDELVALILESGSEA